MKNLHMCMQQHLDLLSGHNEKYNEYEGKKKVRGKKMRCKNMSLPTSVKNEPPFTVYYMNNEPRTDLAANHVKHLSRDYEMFNNKIIIIAFK